MLDPDDINVRQATFGRIVEDFCSSPVGAFLLDKADRELTEAKEALLIADASQVDAIRALQLKARVADKIITWLEDAIRVGHSALEQLKEEDIGG